MPLRALRARSTGADKNLDWVKRFDLVRALRQCHAALRPQLRV
jgi:hypothetical protein